MFSKMKNQTKQPSIISKVTLWYTVFVSLLFIVMFVASFIISGTWSDYESRSELEQETVELSTDLDDFESFDDGIYFALYNQNKEFEKGHSQVILMRMLPLSLVNYLPIAVHK